MLVRSAPSSQSEYYEIRSGTGTYATSQFLPPIGGSIPSESTTPNSPPMIHRLSIVVWNIRGLNNPTFKRNFRELLHQYKPCMVALLETNLVSHIGLKEEFGFDDFFEVPDGGQDGASYFSRTLL